MRRLVDDGAAEFHMRARVYAGVERPTRCAMIERNPREGVELRTPADVVRFLLCGAAMAGFWALLGFCLLAVQP